MFKEKYIKTKKGLTIYTESTGDQKNPPIVLIMGALNQGLFWYDSFCGSLSEQGFFVIRFDHRDTGFSSTINFKESPYDLNDMAEDVIDILDAYKINKANFVGLSMGGYICQLLGINYPEKVKTLTLISTTPDHRPYMDATTGNLNNKYSLPYPKKRYLDFIENSAKNPPHNEQEMEANQIQGWKVTFNDISDKDFEIVKGLIKRSNQRSKNKFSAFNHGMAVMNSPERTQLLHKINAPTFIFHGDHDPCFLVEHAKLMHSLIKNSKLEIISGMGHMFSISDGNYLSQKIIKNIK